MKNLLIILGLSLLLFSCRKNDLEITNLNGNTISVLGHAGMGIAHTYPMNSQESILNCLNIGADGTEIDVQMTKDGVLVAFHDEDLDDKTNFNGKIHEKNWAEIEGAQYTSPNYGGYKLSTLENIFKNIPNQDQYLFILDIRHFDFEKDSNYYDEINTALIDLIDQYNLVENVYIEFKTEKSITTFQAIRPDIKQFIFTGFEYALSLASQYNLTGITVSFEELTSERVELLHEKGFMVSTFNTHSKKRNIEAVELNVDFIQTDRVKHLIDILK